MICFIDWSSIINISWSIDIDGFWLVSIVIDYQFHRLDTPGFVDAIHSGLPLKIQWNPNFSNHGTFPLDLLPLKSVILPPIFWTLDFLKLLLFWTNSCLPWKKFIRNLPSISLTRGKACSFHFNGHTSGFYSQTQKVEPSITQYIHHTCGSKESTAQCLSVEWSLIRPGSPVGAVCYVYKVV